MDDLNKTLPVSNTPPTLANGSSVLSSSSFGSISQQASTNSGSSTSTPLSSAHEADSLDKILADLEAQLKAKQDGTTAHDVKKDIQVDPIKSVSATTSPISTASPSTSTVSTSSQLAVKKPAEIMVEEKHELMNVKSEVKSSESVKSVAPSPTEHAFAMSPGIAAAQKKVVPETVGTVSVMGISSMKKDAAVPTPPSMPGIGDMTTGGITSPVKPKKRNRTGAIIGIALLVFTVLGTGTAIMLNLQPGGVFDSRRYAADNMCNVSRTCTTDAEWISGWVDARKDENKNETPIRDEYTNAHDDQSSQANQQVEIIRHAGEAGVGDPGAGNRTGEVYTVTQQTDIKDANGKTVGVTTTTDKTTSGTTSMGGPAATGPNQAAAGGGLVISDISTNQTIGNACNNPSKYKNCSTYQDWVDGYYAAKTDKFKGVTATQPEYTDAIKDLDGDPSNGFQSGIIQYNPTTKKYEVTQAFTLNVPANFKDMSEEDKKKYVQTNHPGVDPAKSFSVGVNADGSVKLTSTAASGGTSSTGKIPDAWKMKAGGVCNSYDKSTNPSGNDLQCGDVSNGTGFCVPSWKYASDQTTCDGYFKRFGIPVRYQASAEIHTPTYLADAGCNIANSKPTPTSQGDINIITCDPDSKYSICTPYINDASGNAQYKCYPREQSGTITTKGYSVSADGCITSTGGTIAAYSCPPDTTGGCQSGSIPVSGSKVCINQIADAVNNCGKTIQLDVDYGSEHYSINEWLPACGTPRASTPPITFRNPPPTTNTPCTNCGGPEPTPSPAPPGSPVCVGINASIPSPRLGDAPTFTCSPAAEATRYEFRSKIGSGAYATLAPSAANSNVSSPLTVNASGVYTIQCRPCNANGCANWENL